MKAEGGALVALASSVADGDPIDWVQVEAEASDEREREIIRRLKVIASIGEVHRSAEDLDEPRSKVVGRIRPSGAFPVAAVAQAGAPQDQAKPSPAAGVEQAAQTLVPDGDGAAAAETWGHLELRARVGAGVFGEVFRAYDTQLQREVAVKLLKTGTRSADLLAAKVLHEGRLLARVRHHNVVTVHGVESHGDRVGLWMEYLRGCTLEDLLERQGPFSGREAALVGQDLCRALAAVHGAGLVHRDIKAQNVIREEGGRVVLMDFGTGLLLENEESVRSAPIAGTPLYLAPEVLNGRDASPASDVYSVGVLLFHLVTGTYPYAVRSLAELRQAQRKSARQRLQDLRPDLSEGFVQAVDRAMDIDPAARYQSAGALQQGLSAALGFESAPLTASAPNVPPPAPEEPAASVAATAARRLTTRVVVGAVAALLVFVLAGVGLSRYWAPPLAPVDSVVVLPFVHLGSENADLAQGIQLVIADRLSSLSSLRVVRYTSQMQARDRGLALSDVIARHEVAAAIDGDVSWTGSSAKVSVRLMRAGSSSPVWVRQFERPARRAIELPRDVAREIARALSVRLAPAEEARLAEADSAEPGVFESYLRGRAAMRVRTRQANTQAISSFLDALRQDPNHAPSLASIAECYLLEGVTYRVRPLSDAAGLARQAAAHALAIDEELAPAHEVDAQVKFFADWDPDGADRAYQRAIELNPNSGETRQHYAMFLASRRRLPDAMQQMQTAVSLDPTSTQAQAALGMLWHYARSNDQAERVFRGVIQAEPNLIAGRFGLVRTLLAAGRYDEALAHLEELKKITGGHLSPAHLAAVGLAEAGLGRTQEARTVAERLAAEDSNDGPSVDAASVFGAVGDRDRALAILEQAVDERAPKVLFLRLDPRFDSLRGDTRFVRLMSRLGFPS